MSLFAHILALATVALVALSSFPAHANALAADHAQAARHIHVHDAVAKRKRDASSPTTCKPRPSSSPLPTSTPPPATTTTTTTTTPSSTSPPSSTSAASSPTATTNPSKKWGLAWGYDTSVLQNFALPKVKYFYDWRPDLPTQQLQELNLLGWSMLWGWSDAETFASTVTPGYCYGLVGPNEPEQTGQSNMDPASAVSLWQQYMNPHQGQGFRFASPCTTNAPAAMNWTTEFLQLCKNAGCQIDVMCFHGYSTEAQPIIDYANWLHDTTGLPVMMNEFAAQDFSGANDQDSMDQVYAFAQQMVDFVDATSWMESAFPFGAMNPLAGGVNQDNMLLDPSTGQPNDLAHIYFG